MTTKTNPYRLAEKIGNIFLIVLASAVGLAFLLLVHYTFYLKAGWWSLLTIPVIIGIFVVIALIGAGLEWVGDKISRAWRNARWDWEHKNKEEN